MADYTLSYTHNQYITVKFVFLYVSVPIVVID